MYPPKACLMLAQAGFPSSIVNTLVYHSDVLTRLRVESLGFSTQRLEQTAPIQYHNLGVKMSIDNVVYLRGQMRTSFVERKPNGWEGLWHSITGVYDVVFNVSNQLVDLTAYDTELRVAESYTDILF
ncbi:hypothetical protein Tco_0008373 [Tanacetum coccineum]